MRLTPKFGQPKRGTINKDIHSAAQPVEVTPEPKKVKRSRAKKVEESTEK